ncbi:MAG TPA: OmpA family protein [Fluviicoccus sp.]|nr:OmpA family protein [Fluviicoccus sp.]
MSFKHGLLFLAIAAGSLPGCSSLKAKNDPVPAQPGAMTSSPAAAATTDTHAAPAAADTGADSATSSVAANGKKRLATGKPTVSGSATGTDAEGQSRRVASEAGAEQLVSEGNLIYFAYDDFSLGNDDLAVLQAAAGRLKKEAGTALELYCHADERGTVNYNLALGERRGKTVESYLRSLGIEAGRMEVISYGETKPVDDGHNEAAWARNRRVEIHFTTP